MSTLSYSLPCTTKDIQTFVLRKQKYVRSIDQFNEDETLPPRLLFKFFRTARDCKVIRSFNLKWSHVKGLHPKPEVVQKILKKHCHTIDKFSVEVFNQDQQPYSQGVVRSLKKAKTASIHTIKNIRSLLPLHKLQDLKINLKYIKMDPNHIFNSFMELKDLKLLHAICPPASLDGLLQVFDQLSKKKESLKFEVSVEGEDNMNALQLHRRFNRKTREISFQSIQSNDVLTNLFPRQEMIFDNLKALRLEFHDLNIGVTSYLHYFESFSNLESFSLQISHCQDADVAGGIITSLLLPASIQKLELLLPLHFSSLFINSKHMIYQSKTANKKTLPWRDVNIFEEEMAFSSFFQTFENLKKLKTVVFDFYMLESFDPHYTNFITSILFRIPHITALEIQLQDIVYQNKKDQEASFFDLNPFFRVCSEMPDIEQIDILVPNILFKDAVFTPKTRCLKSLTIGVNENEEDNPIKFAHMSKDVERLLKTLNQFVPHLKTLSLDFAEVVTERTLAKRFTMIEKFESLEALGVRFFIKECSSITVHKVGMVLNSLSKLNTLLLKFFQSEKLMFALENYIKYNKSMRNILVQFNETTWMDNECLLDPLNCHVKGGSQMEEENGVS